MAIADLWSRWQQAAAPLAALPAPLPDAASIPPRQWLYGNRYVRGFVSVLAAPGGAGKSALALAQAVALATGRPILGEAVHHSVPAWVLDLEDPPDELNRRLAACLMLHGLEAQQVRGRLYLHAGRTRRLCMAAPAEAGIAFPDRDALIAAAAAQGIGLIVVDPFVKSHTLDENSNPHMDAAATAWAEVAERTGAAVLLVHHVRKLGGGPLDVEAARGAKALTDAARSAAVLSPMSAEDAGRLGVAPADRWRLVRLDDAKANLAPRAEGALWFRLASVRLGNATPAYPGGDFVQAVQPWRPPSAFAGLSAADANRALDAIAAGPGEGLLFTAHRRGPDVSDRWAGRVLERCGLAEGPAAQVIAAWLKSGLLVETDYRDPAQRRKRRGLKVVDAKRPTMADRGAGDAH